jgi:hypothetical protein
MAQGDQKSLARSLGQFFGHLIHSAKSPTPPATRDKQEVRRHVEQEQIQTPQGPVVLRRTIIEEVEIKRPEA